MGSCHQSGTFFNLLCTINNLYLPASQGYPTRFEIPLVTRAHGCLRKRCGYRGSGVMSRYSIIDIKHYSIAC